MACRERGATKILLCVGLFLVASCHCTRLAKLKALDKFRGNSTLSHGQATGSELHHGRLLIGQNSLGGADTDYQADMGWGQPGQPKGHGDENAAVERLLKMEPKVECTGDSMKLQVQDAASTPGSLFFVDRGSRLSPLPLSKLPPSCGYTVRSTRRDLLLVAPYDGCFVALEDDNYVLPLRWLGLPVRMSCPLRQSSPNPPMVTCHGEGMVVKLEWTVSVAKIKLHLNGNWEPLMKASPRCGFSVVVHPEGVVISVRYSPCLEKKDGMYTLELDGGGETKISCPSLSPAQPEPTKIPARVPTQTETTSKAPYHSTPSHNSASTRALDPTPSAVPKVPGFPQNPEVLNEKPNQGPKDFYQPQLPYFPFYPNFYYPYPANPDTKPTPAVQPTLPLIKKNDGQHSQTVPPAKLPLNPEGQVPQPIVPSPFYPWPAQPERPGKELPLKPQSTQQLDGQEKQPLYPYPFYVKLPNPDGVPPAQSPEPTPLPFTAPTVITKDQRWQPSYPLPIYPQPPKPDTLPKEPPVTKPPPGKVKEPFLTNPPNHPSQPPQEPIGPSESQEHKPLYVLPPYPWPPQPPASEAPQVEPPYPLYPGKLLPEHPVLPKPPVSEEQIYQTFYPYLFLPQGPYALVPPTQTPTPAPEGQIQSLSTLQPKISIPEAPEKLSPGKSVPESKGPPQPEAHQGHLYNPFYPGPFYPNPFHLEPENQPAPKPPHPEAPQGQMYQSLYPFFPQPEPENQPGPKPPQPDAPQGQMYQPLYPITPPPEPENQPAPKPPQPEAPQGQMYQPLYPFIPQPEPENQPAPKPPQPEVPQGQMYQPLYPFIPQPEPENQPAPKSPLPEDPQGQMYQPLYPFFPQPELENQAAPKPPQPEAPQGQMYQPWYPFFPQPEPEKTTAVPKPLASETPKEHLDKPSYPQSFKPPAVGTNGVKVPTVNPVQSEKPSPVKHPESQVPHHFSPYHYVKLPQHPQPLTVSPSTSMQQPQQATSPASGQTSPESAISKPSKGGQIPQVPELGSSYIPPVYCPQFCPSGFSNCCPQIAFHQHLHHIVQAGPDKDAPPVYPGLPFLPSVASSGFANGFVSPPPQKPTETAITSTSAPISPQSISSGNEKQPYLQPPDGNPAALPESNPSKPTHFDPNYPYSVPNSLYPYWLYPPQFVDLQNLAQSQSTHYSVPSKTQAPGNEPVIPVVPYIQPPKQQNYLSAGNTNSPSGPNFMSFISQNQQQQHTAKQQNKPTAKELQPPNTKSSESQTHPKVQSELDHLQVPYYMLQDAQAPTYNKPALPNNSVQPIVSGSKKLARHDQTAYSEPKSYVLLQHGPPGREVNRFSEPVLPSRHLGHDANLAQNLVRHHSGKHQRPQNLRPLQEKTQHPKWLGNGMSNPLPSNVNYMPRPGDESKSLLLPLSALGGPHFVPSPQDPSLSVAHLNPKFFDSNWKPMTPQGSSQRIPAHVPGKAFQQWRSAADQVNGKGLNQPIQRGGNPKQK